MLDHLNHSVELKIEYNNINIDMCYDIIYISVMNHG